MQSCSLTKVATVIEYLKLWQKSKGKQSINEGSYLQAVQEKELASDKQGLCIQR